MTIDAALRSTQEFTAISTKVDENKSKLLIASCCLIGVAMISAVAIGVLSALGLSLVALVPLALTLPAVYFACGCGTVSLKMNELGVDLRQPSRFMQFDSTGQGVEVSSQSLKTYLTRHTLGFDWFIDIILGQMAEELPPTVSFV